MTNDKLGRRRRTKADNEALIERIRPLRERGLSGEQIARKLGDVSSENVRYFCRVYGMKRGVKAPSSNPDYSDMNLDVRV